MQAYVQLYGILILQIIFLLLSVLSAEETRIKKVLDSNLFELKDGRIISLAYVDVPSVSDSNEKLGLLALNIKNYAENQFLGRNVIIQFDSLGDQNSEPIPVHLFQKFPFKTVCYNKLYLQKGFGKLVIESDTQPTSEYIRAEKEAKAKNRGLWEENLYMSKPLQMVIPSLIFGFGNYRSLNGPYQEALLFYQPLGPGFGFRCGTIHAKEAIEFKGYKQAFVSTWFNPYWTINSKYFGIEPGLILFKSPDYLIPEISSDLFLLPNGSLRVGLINRLYLSFDFLTDLLYTPASWGVNFLNKEPYLKLWIGYTPANEEKNIISIGTEVLFLKRVLIKFEGVSYNYHMSDEEQTYGMRFGAGYLFRH